VQVSKGEIDEDVLLKMIEEENLINNKKNKKLTTDENSKLESVGCAQKIYKDLYLSKRARNNKNK
jgi:hypothetical protein